jgi:hypothetical protein
MAKPDKSTKEVEPQADPERDREIARHEQRIADLNARHAERLARIDERAARQAAK